MSFLATEMFKGTTCISPPIVNELFNSNEGNNYNLRDPSDRSLPIVKTAFSGLESLSNLGPNIWEIVPPEIKEIDSLVEFKNKIRL